MATREPVYLACKCKGKGKKGGSNARVEWGRQDALLVDGGYWDALLVDGGYRRVLIHVRAHVDPVMRCDPAG